MPIPEKWEPAKLGDIKAGDQVVVDDGFDCINPWSVLAVQQDDDGELFIPCTSGRHYISGQEDRKHGVYVGLMLYNPKKV